MVKQEVNVHNEAGLHARPANVFVKTAAQMCIRDRLIPEDSKYDYDEIVKVYNSAK